MNSRSATRSRRAVTLIEVLVTVAVAVILTLIVIVGMRSVRGQTLAMKDLHNLRLSGQDMLLWSADNDEKFLNLGPEYPGLWDAILGPEIAPLSPDSFVSFYWGQQASWNGILHTLTKNAHEHWQSAYGPETLPTHEGTGSPVGGPPAAERGTIQYAVSITRFLYSPCFITDPLAWEGDFRFNRTTDLMPFFKTTRMSQIRSPAGKGLLINKQIPGANDQAHVVFVDGSTESRAIANFVPPTYYPTASLPTTPGVPVLHTKQGVNGRDR